MVTKEGGSQTLLAGLLEEELLDYVCIALQILIVSHKLSTVHHSRTLEVFLTFVETEHGIVYGTEKHRLPTVSNVQVEERFPTVA